MGLADIVSVRIVTTLRERKAAPKSGISPKSGTLLSRTSSLVLTKLDEATGLGNLLPLLRNCHLPISYLTDGQNVPDDIEAADQRRLARQILGWEANESGRP